MPPCFVVAIANQPPTHHHRNSSKMPTSHHPFFLKTIKTSPKILSLPLSQNSLRRQVPNVSSAVRAEFARGDGRIKRKEDERRRQIQPNETLFVVNFHEETTKREDLDMLFSPYGKIVRIEMKRNYAFVQFETIDQAIAAKDATNGGKLDQVGAGVDFELLSNSLTFECRNPQLPQSELTVEYVARRMGESRGPPRRRYDDDRR